MKGYIDFLYRWRWAITIFVPLIVVMLASTLKHLEIDGSYRIWFEKDSQTLRDYDRFRETFSNDDGITIVFRDEQGIFNQKALASVRRITDALWDTPHIDRVDSIVNYQYIHVNADNPDEIVVEDFIADDLAKVTPDYLAKRFKIAVADEIIRDSFISKDGKTTMIFARLEPDANEHGDISAEMMGYVKKIVESEANKTGYTYWLNGGPVMTQAFVDIAGRDAMIFTPLVLAASMVLLWLLFRRVSGALLPLGVVLFTFVTVLVVQTLLGYKLNNFTANIPVFIVAIGIADAVHIYAVWLMYKQEGTENKEAVLRSLEKNVVPVVLTSLTTIIGFSTLAVSHIVPVATLGIATASGAALAFVFSVFWLPAVLLLLHRPVNHAFVHTKTQKRVGYGSFIVKYHRTIVLLGTLIAALMGAGLAFVKVDSNAIKYFDKDVELRRSAEFTMKHLTGSMAYILLVDSGKKDGIKDPRFLQTVDRFYRDFQARFPRDVRHIFSLLDIIKRYHAVMNGTHAVPNDANLIAQYLLLYGMSVPQGMEITDQMDFDQRVLRLTALTNIVDTSKDLAMIKYAKQWWANTPYQLTVTGQTAMYATMQHDVTKTLIYSLALTIVLISLVMVLAFKRFKIVWILLLPNLLPVVLVLGVMGWLGIAVDLGVAISGAIIIGVAVDDTVHFLVKYFQARRQGLTMRETLDEVMRYAGKAIVFTTVVLAVSFALFVFSDFTPNRNFGIVTATALIIALVVDLFYLPALLTLVDNDHLYTKESYRVSSP